LALPGDHSSARKLSSSALTCSGCSSGGLIRFQRIRFSSFQICLSEERGPAIDFPGHVPGHQELRTSYLTDMVLVLSNRVVRAVQFSGFMSGHCSVEAVTQILGMHRLTLYPWLQQLGTTFEVLLNQRRCALAQAMRHRPNISTRGRGLVHVQLLDRQACGRRYSLLCHFIR